MTDYLRPTTLAEACAFRAEHTDYVVIAGCTDVLVDPNKRKPEYGVIDVFGLADIRGIQLSEREIILGASTTYAEVLQCDVIDQYLPMLKNACRQIGAMQIQSRGTLGGNLVTSSPVGDTLPVWLAANAQIELVSIRGTRLIAYQEFIVGYREIDMAKDEIVASIRVPKESKEWTQHFRKVGTRAAQSISKLMLAGVAQCTNGQIDILRLSLGAVADRPIRLDDAEKLAVGRFANQETALLVQQKVLDAISPISDLRSSSEYRKHVAARLCASFIESLEPLDV